MKYPTITPQFRDEHMNIHYTVTQEGQYIRDHRQNSHIKHLNHHSGLSFQFLVYFPYASWKKKISRLELPFGRKRADKSVSTSFVALHLHTQPWAHDATLHHTKRLVCATTSPSAQPLTFRQSSLYNKQRLRYRKFARVAVKSVCVKRGPKTEQNKTTVAGQTSKHIRPCLLPDETIK